MNFADRLFEAIKEKGNPSCVGLDPHLDSLPPTFVKATFSAPGLSLQAIADTVFQFNKGIIDAIADIVPAIKPQIAFYEQLGPPGLEAYAKTIVYAKKQGLIVIGDIKRSDIGSTAQAYSNAHLGKFSIGEISFNPPFGADAITLNPYLGTDAVEPFIKTCGQSGCGVFVLVRTSNPSSDDIQSLRLETGEALFIRVASLTKKWGEGLVGQHGYSSIGAVVGATHPKDALVIRAAMPKTFFLVPGYGAQGANASDVAPLFDENGNGAIVVSARKIIYAYKASKDPTGLNWQEDARSSAIQMREELRKTIKGFDNH